MAEPAAPAGQARRTGALLALGCALVLALAAAWLIPWSWLPGERVGAVAARDVFTAEHLTRAERYSGAQQTLAWARLAISLVLAVGLALGGWGGRLAARVPGPWWAVVALTTLALQLVGELAVLPLALRSRGYALAYGLTEQTLGGWLQDRALSLLVGTAVLAAAVLLVVGTARRFPRRWPLVAGLGAAVLAILGSFGYPVVVEPLFNRFESLPDGPLRSEVLALAEREGVPVSDVLVADASRRTTTLNAYVSGLGATRRVVVYDNLLREAPQAATLSVVAHELAHADNHDVAVGTGLTALGLGAAAGLLALGLANPRLRRRGGFTGAADPRATASILALVAVGSLVVSPIQSVMSRAVEARADRDALAATQDYPAFEQLQRELARHSLADPTPPRVRYLLFSTHPTVLQRLELSRQLRLRAQRR